MKRRRPVIWQPTVVNDLSRDAAGEGLAALTFDRDLTAASP
jgi:hypothetical protein